MTTFFLIRHGMCEPVGHSLAGRAPGVSLNAIGHAQVDALVKRMAGIPLDAVYSSPLERARETAAPLAIAAGVEVELVEAVTEIDFGDWTGRTFAELAGDLLWVRFNSVRSMARVPHGELMLEVQARTITALEDMRRAHPDGACAVVSHGDVIRSAVAHFAGIPLDLFQRLEISPASVSVVRATHSEVSIRCVNETGVPMV
jgi:probable phosphomutase (TIGR03848 family)